MNENQPADAVIPARSRRRAMDWSLVLLSQGIESTLAYDERGWSLQVSPAELSRALVVLDQYQRENRRWRWRRELWWPAAPFHWGVVAWCALLALAFFWSETVPASAKALGEVDSIAVRQGQWWRLFTAIGLHADLSHLAANLTTGFLVLGLAMARWGPGPGLLFAWLGGVLGNLLSFLVHSAAYRSLGASGMVMAGLGLLGAASLRSLRHGESLSKWVVRGLLGVCLLFVLLGLDPASDVLAHLGGFLGGLLLGAGLVLLPEKFSQGPAFGSACALLLGSLVALTWILALG